MPRNSERFNTQAAKDEIQPILFVRILNIPHKTDGTTENLYLCDSQENIQAYDETGEETVTYIHMPLLFKNCEVSKDNPVSQGTLSADNINREWSVLAGNYNLVGAEIHVLRGFPETVEYSDGLALIMSGHIEEPTITESSISLTIDCDFSLNMRVPRFMYSTNNFPYIPSAKDVRSIFTGKK